ncbi:hypothetical protein SMACR_00299 [Sordaria macrospora]|uniref:WGS project CABT00000000 data, contig 2.1 n=2 Tax=Sordaria macrospora TaxID=5147 RepID=F7VKQ5_SORMK|nr:uncharacterized protein SMAC_00299 [Sordaria macrospora k-hell]KAA8636871.1 hypothetical protein SMACR_00299 [Sordaria macrospora]WPJ59044.1 hypothetical protein SMAC4_00299 [Sordaria macrospora]CCC06082.1 unnamed protein product [Sordaria macrospora k-hell]
MVHLTPLALVAMSLLTLVTAAPTAKATTDSEPVFSFAKWVDDLTANPDTALGPEEAWQAYLNTVNSTSTFSAVPVAEKRWDAAVICNDIAPGPAYAPDAVWCINYLAAKGSAACITNTVSAFCFHGNAQITGVSGSGFQQSTW